MELSKRGWLGLTALLSAVLTGVVVRDIFVDWIVEGKSLWSTLLENAVPITLGASILAAGYVVYQRRGEQYLETVTRWQYAGAAVILLVALEVIGLQIVQGELKPRLIIIQMTIGGAVAGTLVGFANARSREAQAQTRRERDKFEALFDNAPAESAEVRLQDGDTLIEATNPAFDHQFVADDDSAVGNCLFDIVSHERGQEAAIEEAIEAGETEELELHTPTSSGPRSFQLSVVPFGSEERAYLLYSDVTELRNAQKDLEETVQRLEASNDRLQQFAYVASHDLQEPARMVSSYVSLLDQEYGDQFDEEAKEYMDFAIDGADRMQDMIDGLLDYARVRTQAEEFEAADAEAVLEETLQNLELLVTERDVTVTHDDLPTVHADRNQLGQLFQNLIENAIEHGGQEIHVGAERQDGEVVFSVSDDGPGIPENRQERIFEIFEQGSRDNDGTGIGLAICDRIVSRHGGSMSVESAEGEGATFSFSVPA
jgi:signal transduction histidine kinase